MIDITNLIESGANIKLEVTPEDLKMFAESVVERTITAHAQVMEQNALVEETYLNTKQVRERLNICEGTLNTWAKRGYLVPVKVGNKNMYALSDVLRIQHGNRSETVTEYCKRHKVG
jgi:predicted ATPase